MRESWNGLISLGIVHPMIYPETLSGEGAILETVAKIAEDESFGAIEVSWIKDPKTRGEVANLLRTAFMDIVYCGGPPILIQKLDMNSLDQDVRSTSVENVKRLVDEAYSLGARIIAVLSGPDVEADKRDTAKSLLVDSLKEVCRYAEEKGEDYIMMVSVENFDREQDKKLLLGPTKEAADVIGRVKAEYKNIGLTVDLSHLPLLGESSEHALTVAEPYLEHVHVGNCVLKDKNHPLYGDQHPRFGIHGGESSIEELTEYLRVLKEIGFFRKKTATRLPVVTFEVKPSPGESSDILIANSKRVFAEAWAKI